MLSSYCRTGWQSSHKGQRWEIPAPGAVYVGKIPGGRCKCECRSMWWPRTPGRVVPSLHQFLGRLALDRKRARDMFHSHPKSSVWIPSSNLPNLNEKLGVTVSQEDNLQLTSQFKFSYLLSVKAQTRFLCVPDCHIIQKRGADSQLLSIHQHAITGSFTDDSSELSLWRQRAKSLRVHRS